LTFELIFSIDRMALFGKVLDEQGLALQVDAHRDGLPVRARPNPERLGQAPRQREDQPDERSATASVST
jgi:hypothetical protein